MRLVEARPNIGPVDGLLADFQGIIVLNADGANTAVEVVGHLVVCVAGQVWHTTCSTHRTQSATLLHEECRSLGYSCHCTSAK